MPLDAAHARNILDASNGTAAFVATVTPVRDRLMTANGTGTTPGTELATGGGYTAGTGAPTITHAAAVVSGAQAIASSNVGVTVTNMPASTIVGVETWDSTAPTPARKWYGPLATSKTLAAGDTFSIAAGSQSDALGI